MKSIRIVILLVLASTIAIAQQWPAPTSSVERLESVKKVLLESKSNPINNIQFRNVGPTITSGRVTGISVNPKNPTEFYVGYASGGLWKTTNNGMSFKSVFDNQEVMTIGDIDVDWENGETIWIGTGESNAILWAGLGVYKSTDKGKSWTNTGLVESQHINRIAVHPKDPKTVYVAAMGRLYTTSKDRGVYKTTDGGKTWEHSLFINDSTGATDLVIDPNNPDIIYAATWERYRKAWMRHKGGEGSGIYKSVDGGKNWNKITSSENGFPSGIGGGRIGLTVHNNNSNILYAVIDNQEKREQPDKPVKKDGLSKEDFRTMDSDSFLELDKKDIAKFLKKNNFPKKYTAASVKEMVKAGKIKPVALVEYLEDANFTMYNNLPVKGAELYRTDYGGKNWYKTHESYLDGLFFSYGYVFDIVRVSPTDPNKVYVAGVPIIVSEDGGKTFKNINESNVHVDHHALWVNPENDKHIVNGNDGGMNISYDGGVTWFKANTPAVSQLYSVSYDMAKTYNVYAGMQDNGVWKGTSNYRSGLGWRASGEYAYNNIMGGDGFQTQIDFRDNNIAYTGYQYGAYYRINMDTDDYNLFNLSMSLVKDLYALVGKHQFCYQDIMKIYFTLVQTDYTDRLIREMI